MFFIMYDDDTRVIENSCLILSYNDKHEMGDVG